MKKHTDTPKTQLAPILEVAAGYSKEMGTNVLALVGKGECYNPGGEAVAVIAIHSKASAKDNAYAERLALRYNTHADLVAALEKSIALTEELYGWEPIYAEDRTDADGPSYQGPRKDMPRGYVEIDNNAGVLPEEMKERVDAFRAALSRARGEGGSHE